MASRSRVPSFIHIHLLPASLLLATLILISSADAQRPSPFPSGPERQAHIHFFFHDVLNGSNPTAIEIVNPPGSNSGSRFGVVVMADNALTETEDPSSKLLGRGQGMYASASQTEMSFLMALNLVFVSGEFNGSTLSLLGRNPITEGVRELAVVGGNGALRMARGYALARTRSTAGINAVVEYDVYAVYYQNVGSG